MRKNIMLAVVTFIIVSFVPMTADAATPNVVEWQKNEINTPVPCTFTVVEYFKGYYYAFAGYEIISEGGSPFVAIRSQDKINWEKMGDFGSENDVAVTAAKVFKNKNGKTHLYIATQNKQTGTNVYRTKNGEDWNRVIANGLNSENNTKVRSIGQFKGKLYLFTENVKDQSGFGSYIFVSGTGKKDNWKARKFGDTGGSAGSFDAVTFKKVKADGSKKKCMYLANGAATLVETCDGETWKNVDFDIDKKGYGVELEKFNGYMYMATWNENDLQARLYRSKNPRKNGFKRIDTPGLGTGDEMISSFARKKKKPKYLYMGTYSATGGHIYRIGKDTTALERMSEKELGVSFGPNFIDPIVQRKSDFVVFGNQQRFWSPVKELD